MTAENLSSNSGDSVAIEGSPRASGAPPSRAVDFALLTS
jgi:hypothetical protein